MWAITPKGIGRPPGARRIRPGWELKEDEFVVEEFSPDMVLADDGISLRQGTPEELKTPPGKREVAIDKALDWIATQPNAPKEIKDFVSKS